VAHFLQRNLPTTPKPIFDSALRLHIPNILGDAAVLRSAPFAGTPGFPSERAVLFAGLAIAILLVHFELGLLALACTLVVELARVYLGLHYPTNALGSLALAATLAWLAQTRPSLELGALVLRWEHGAPPSFYLCSFLASYAVVAFQDLRELAKGLLQ
ncbi:MAG: phosphatase PAP2 family protein, partial [Mesorhizobium sp.]